MSEEEIIQTYGKRWDIDVIGKVGNVGHSSGAPLHFEFFQGQSEVTSSAGDPLSKYPKFNVNVGERIPAI